MQSHTSSFRDVSTFAVILPYRMFSTPPLPFLHHILRRQSRGLWSIVPETGYSCAARGPRLVSVWCVVSRDEGERVWCSPWVTKWLFVLTWASSCRMLFLVPGSPRGFSLAVWKYTSGRTCPKASALQSGASCCLRPRDSAAGRSVSTALKLCALDPLSVETYFSVCSHLR